MRTGRQADNKEGYHSFMNVDGVPFGSFEVFWTNRTAETTNQLGIEENFEPGWYWWACFPGYMPESSPFGPFDSSEQAYKNAVGNN